MAWRRLLLTALVMGSLTNALPAAATSPGSCSTAVAAFGQCDAQVTTENAGDRSFMKGLVEGIERGEGSSPPSADTSESLFQSPTQQQARPTTPVEDFCSPVDPADCRMSAAESEPLPAGEPAVTMRDIASFRPAEPGNGMEPGGWAVVGLPANFVAESSVQTLSGTLLGRPAEVRFHPVAYRWTHSDGAVVQTSTPGSTWEALGQAEFTETATSHVYAASGDYAVDIAVVFVAEYRFNGSVWRWIDGTLSVPGAPQSVLVGEFDTVLVTGDCRVAPDGPGC